MLQSKGSIQPPWVGPATAINSCLSSIFLVEGGLKKQIAKGVSKVVFSYLFPRFSTIDLWNQALYLLIGDQNTFKVPTNSRYRPIQGTDQFKVPTNSRYRPINELELAEEAELI